ncbi:MAG: hypothetical protein DLM58_02405 [Pseudonocardiales bacterium]|nr:MAG: hypothetical protein DLM58_02405 [Pseudonocardiales bacterium]
MRASVIAAALGLAAGVAVTRHAHESPSSPWWDGRVGATPLRRSDLPMGGAVALVLARLLRKAGRRGTARAVTGLGLGAALGAVGTGLLDPLPSP